MIAAPCFCSPVAIVYLVSRPQSIGDTLSGFMIVITARVYHARGDAHEQDPLPAVLSAKLSNSSVHGRLANRVRKSISDPKLGDKVNICHAS